MLASLSMERTATALLIVTVTPGLLMTTWSSPVGTMPSAQLAGFSHAPSTSLIHWRVLTPASSGGTTVDHCGSRDVTPPPSVPMLALTDASSVAVPVPSFIRQYAARFASLPASVV